MQFTEGEYSTHRAKRGRFTLRTKHRNVPADSFIVKASICLQSAREKEDGPGESDDRGSDNKADVAVSVERLCLRCWWLLRPTLQPEVGANEHGLTSKEQNADDAETKKPPMAEIIQNSAPRYLAHFSILREHNHLGGATSAVTGLR